MNRVKKKGGIFIKKIIIFLITCFALFTLKVKAETSTFYEAEYISNIYIDRYQYSTNLTYYQQARFFRERGTNDFVYCIEPFMALDENIPYVSTPTPSKLTQQQVDLIANIAHFGYGYGNHTDKKWYAITQVMIWKIADPSGDYYFTDRLNGNRINIYIEEMDEINRLIDNYLTIPSFANKTYNLVEGNTLILEDTNNSLSNFTTNNNIQIENNKGIIKNLTEGTYRFTLTKGDSSNNPALFYPSASSQNLVKRGNTSPINCTITINVQKTTVTIHKIDKDTQSITPSGEASLKGTTFTLYDQNNQKIKDFPLEENSIIIENLNYGKYYLKETQVGTGYFLNPNTYEINISNEKTKVELTIENEVIKKKIILEKKYGDNTHLETEENISFSITNSQEEIISQITTNEKGIAEIILPYGTYTITQLNTTEGYEKLAPFTITVTSTEEEIIELRDLEIPVPNTYLEDNHSFSFLFYLLWFLFL